MAERHAHAGPGTARALADIRTAERELVGNLPIWTPAGLRGASCEPRWARRLTSGCTDGSQIVLEHPVLRADTLSGTVRGPKEQQDVRIPLSQVREVATRGFSAGRTIRLALGVAAGTFAVIVVAAVISCRHSQCFE